MKINLRLTALSLALSLAPLLGASHRSAAHSNPNLAPTPPMGWNSWDSYGAAVREENVRANADYMAAHLAKYGWQYIVVDIQWYEPHAQGHEYRAGAALTMDQYGRLLPAENRFPSAADGAGFKPLADYVHSKGLKFGIHILRGIPRQAVAQNTPIAGSHYRAADIADKQSVCLWNTDMYGIDMSKPGAQDYYDSIVALYASWGVDFIKADDIARPFHGDEIAALHRAIVKSGRPMVLSLSPGPAPLAHAAELEANAQMWRISDDFWDDWKLLRQQFDYTRDWAKYIGNRDTWPDADMLPLGKLRITDKNGTGKTHFTPDEQQTVMTLWCIARSPLIFGGDLPSLDPATLRLITNPDVIAVDQRSMNNHEAFHRGSIRAWVGDTPLWIAHRTIVSPTYIAVFNLGDTEQDVNLRWSELGLPTGSFPIFNLWRHKQMGASDGLRAHLPAHGSGLYRLQIGLPRAATIPVAECSIPAACAPSRPADPR